VKGRNTGITFVDAGGDMDAIEPAAASDVRAAEADDEEPADKEWGRSDIRNSVACNLNWLKSVYICTGLVVSYEKQFR
jgi:hypothetical protein